MTQVTNDTLGATLAAAHGNPANEAAALRALSQQSLFVILQQPPGPGSAAPERNLVQWRRDSDGIVFVPVFTDPAHIPFQVPPPARLVRVSMRVLVRTWGSAVFIVNPLSPEAFEVDAARLAQLRAFLAEQGYDPMGPSPEAPWAFHPPSDGLYPVAYALASWFVAHGRVDEAYLYELDQLGLSSPQMQIVLGLNEPLDPVLAKTLTDVAVQAGAPAEGFVVRFLPDEPSHQAGIENLGLGPFYLRPRSG